MKKTLGAALFCTLAGFAGATPVVAASSGWTGCYVGGNAGGAWTQQKLTFLPPSTESANKLPEDSDIAGGAQIGCDDQAGLFVWGIQGMFDWSSLDGRKREENLKFADSYSIRGFGNVTGRVGYAVTPDSILYAKGGVAWMKTDYVNDLAIGGSPASDDLHRTGWTAGAGWEKMIGTNWSFFVEFNYADFGHKTISFVGHSNDAYQKLQTVLVGLNYRFATSR
jgi:outer membrane immunogenic protein